MRGHIHRHAQVGVNAVGRGGRAAQPNFFLGAEDEVQLVGGALQLFQRLDHDRHADAVVHGLRDQAVVQIEEGALENRHVAHLHRAVFAVEARPRRYTAGQC